MPTHNEYATTSIPEAAFLLTRGHALRRIEPTPHDPRVRAFVFEASAAQDAPLYVENTPVPARTFYQRVAELKAALYPRVLRRGAETPKRSNDVSPFHPHA